MMPAIAAAAVFLFLVAPMPETIFAQAFAIVCGVAFDWYEHGTRRTDKTSRFAPIATFPCRTRTVARRCDRSGLTLRRSAAAAP